MGTALHRPTGKGIPDPRGGLQRTEPAELRAAFAKSFPVPTQPLEVPEQPRLGEPVPWDPGLCWAGRTFAGPLRPREGFSYSPGHVAMRSMFWVFAEEEEKKNRADREGVFPLALSCIKAFDFTISLGNSCFCLL